MVTKHRKLDKKIFILRKIMFIISKNLMNLLKFNDFLNKMINFILINQ